MSKLLIQEPPLQVLPSLAMAVGLNEAIILQQVHYWLEINTKSGRNVIDGEPWCYHTYEGWREQFPFWSIETIKRCIRNLEKTGILIATTDHNRHRSNRTKWYTIDYEALEALDHRGESHDHEVKMTSPTGQNDPLYNGSNCPIGYTETPETTHRDNTDADASGESPPQSDQGIVSGGEHAHGEPAPSPPTPPSSRNLPHEIVAAYQEVIGAPVTNKGKAYGAAKKLATAGLQPEEVTAMVDWLNRQDWVRERGFDLGTMVNQYEKWRMSTGVQEEEPLDPNYLGAVNGPYRRNPNTADLPMQAREQAVRKTLKRYPDLTPQDFYDMIRWRWQRDHKPPTITYLPFIADDWVVNGKPRPKG